MWPSDPRWTTKETAGLNKLRQRPWECWKSVLLSSCHGALLWAQCLFTLTHLGHDSFGWDALMFFPFSMIWHSALAWIIRWLQFVQFGLKVVYCYTLNCLDIYFLVCVFICFSWPIFDSKLLIVMLNGLDIYLWSVCYSLFHLTHYGPKVVHYYAIMTIHTTSNLFLSL